MPLKRTLRIRESLELPLFDRLVLALLFVLLLTDVLDGAIRYYALQLHMVWLPYLPRFFLALALGPMLLARVLSEGITSTYLALLVLFSVATTYGVFNLGNAGQVEFGFWVLVPFLFGVVVCESLIRCWRRLTPYVVLLWTLAAGGVLINVFHTWPWAGLQYQVGGTEVNAAHLWQTGGFQISRLTGFTRSWFEAALQILFLALFLRKSLQRRWWVPIWILSGVAIALTTTKTTLVVFLLFSALWIFRGGRISRFWRTLPIILVSLDALFPLSVFFIDRYWLGESSSPTANLLIATLAARMQQEWPEAIKMIMTRGGPLMGRGMGGIGSAQMFFEPAIQNAGENIAIFLYGYFGLLGLILLFVYAWRASRLPTENPVGYLFFCCACVVLLEGATMSVLEASVFLPLAFGASIWYVQKATVKPRPHGLAAEKQRLGPIAAGNSQPQCT